MTNKETSGPRQTRSNWFNQYGQKKNRLAKRMADILALGAMTSKDIPKFVADRVPTPAKEDIFSHEPQGKETNSLLVEMRQWPSTARLTYMLRFAETLAVSSVIILVCYLSTLKDEEVFLFGSPLAGATAYGFVTGLVVVYTAASLIRSTYAHMKLMRIIQENTSHVEALILESDAKFWNTERLKKWAVARYRLTSGDTFMMILGVEGTMGTGPMKGRFVSTSDGKEWTLRPEMAEAV